MKLRWCKAGHMKVKQNDDHDKIEELLSIIYID